MPVIPPEFRHLFLQQESTAPKSISQDRSKLRAFLSHRALLDGLANRLKRYYSAVERRFAIDYAYWPAKKREQAIDEHLQSLWPER